MESIIVILALIGAVDSLYVLMQRYFSKLPTLCFSTDGHKVDCYNLLHTKYAAVFKIVPNSFLGVVFYVLIAYMYNDISAFANLIGLTLQQTYLSAASLATLGMLFGWYLLYVQARILKVFCMFCVTSTTLLTAITVMAWMLV